MRIKQDYTCAEWDNLYPSDERFNETTASDHPLYGDAPVEPAKSVNPKIAAGNAKLPLHLVPMSAMCYMATGLGEGAKKYGPFNYRESDVSTDVYVGAALRHLMAFQDGQDIDQESGNPHLAHALASLAILVDTIESGRAIDTRPTNGQGPAVLARLSNKDT